ncbi:hypothetical protein ACFRCQ_15180 [Cytobacillus firmus]|uniref:hypothetical protein n=1 Tax=Cytobacillus firmus TaxID=1399 RepID=UPI0036B0B1C0
MNTETYLEYLIARRKKKHKRLLFLLRRTRSKRIKDKLQFKVKVSSMTIKTLEEINNECRV